MSFNLVKEEQEAEELKRREAFERHQKDGQFAALADREYNRILIGCLVHQKFWVGWAQCQLDDIESDALREELKRRLNGFQTGISAPRSL